MRIHIREYQTPRDAVGMQDGSERVHLLDRSQACIGDLVRQPDVEVEAKRRGDLLLKVPAESAMQRIDTPYQLAFVEAQAEHAVRLAFPGWPLWLLPRQDDRQTIGISQHRLIHRHIERK